jgi:nitroreductase
MTTTGIRSLDEKTLGEALRLAARAPSATRAEPWTWRTAENRIDLLADTVDRECLLACGAALHHLRVALAAMGWRSAIERMPRPTGQGHVARVVPHWDRDPAVTDIASAAAISLRRTNLREYSGEVVPWSVLSWLVERAYSQGAVLQPVIDTHLREQVLRGNADVRSEAAGALLVLTTEGDDEKSWLRAGEAMSAVLLAATVWGLASCAVPGAIMVPALRTQLRQTALGRVLHPQVVLRVGWQQADR